MSRLIQKPERECEDANMKLSLFEYALLDANKEKNISEIQHEYLLLNKSFMLDYIDILKLIIKDSECIDE